MGDDKKISINDGRSGKKTYYYYDSFETYEEAIKIAKMVNNESKVKIRYFIIPCEEGWFLPVNKFKLYFDKEIQ